MSKKKKDESCKVSDGGCCGGDPYNILMQSVEEEIKQEDWKKLWDKYGKFVSSALIGVLLCFGVYTMWQKQDLNEREAISSRFIVVQSMIVSGRLDEALSQIKSLSVVDKTEYATLAKFEYAGVLLQKKDAEVLKVLKSVYENQKSNAILRDLAYIFYVNASLDFMTNEELTKNIDQMIKDLSTKHINVAWKLIANESLAFCYMKLGNKQLAKQTLENLIKTEGIPQNMSERSKILLKSL